jgi:hypothetical protein
VRHGQGAAEGGGQRDDEQALAGEGTHGGTPEVVLRDERRAAGVGPLRGLGAGLRALRLLRRMSGGKWDMGLASRGGAAHGCTWPGTGTRYFPLNGLAVSWRVQESGAAACGRVQINQMNLEL